MNCGPFLPLTLLFLQVDGGDPQCHGPHKERPRAQQQGVHPSLSSAASAAFLLLLLFPGLCFSFIHISGTFLCVQAHLVLFFKKRKEIETSMVTRPLV